MISTVANALNKAHVRYLERRLVEIARNVGRTDLDNGATPTGAGLTEAATVNMEVFLDILLMILPALRIDSFLEQTRPSPTQQGKSRPATPPQPDPSTDLESLVEACFELNVPRKGVSPFHEYTMRQAIEEGFIMDVLANYTTYKRFYGLVKQIEGDPKVPRREAAKALGRYMTLHPYNIEQVVVVIVEHFRQNVMHELGGRAKRLIAASDLSVTLHGLRRWLEESRDAGPWCLARGLSRPKFLDVGVSKIESPRSEDQTVAEKSRARVWLRERLSQPVDATKAAVGKELKSLFQVSDRSFKELWTSVIDETGRTDWRRPGQKSSR